MPTPNLRNIKTFKDLVRYLQDELDWPLGEYSFEDSTYEYLPAELGLKDEQAAQVKTIHQLRPLRQNQPWGIFFVEFEKKRMPVVVLRRVLSHLVIKKRASANKAQAAAWNLDDLIFVSAFGPEASDQREIAFAHFHQEMGDLPTLRVLGWDGADTPLKLDHVAATLKERLRWPDDPDDIDAWRQQWTRAFRHRLGHVIRTADALAERLALLARNIHAAAHTLMEHESERGPLRRLYQAFQAALIHDLSEADFADTYAQTITYGLLTAAISRTEMSEGRYGTALVAEDVTEMVPITNPFLRDMLQTFLQAGGRRGGINFDELGIQDVVELLRGDETDLPAILRDFGNRTRGQDPVIHFYEHFLAAYDKRLKVQRGIFYTPQPVVSYIVRSVHELLQTEFGLQDGLASTLTWGEMAARQPGLKIPQGTDAQSPFVVVLDPATGTATFLVEVIDVIYKTLTAKWEQQRLSKAQQAAAWNDYVPKHLLPRLYGYELMMAPYAIAHMKIGLKLYETGYRFGSDERVRVYLTNALEPASDDGKQMAFAEWAPALALEAQAVNEVKCDQHFTVVIGNPPYANFGQLNRIPFVLGLLEDYKRGLNEKKLNLDDDYLKFFRFGQYVFEQSSAGIFGMITNSSFLDGLVHRKMRESLLQQFCAGQITDLHGNSRRGDITPDGSPDENVFDIQQGVAISIWTKSTAKGKRQLGYVELWGKREEKYAYLAARTMLSTPAVQLEPEPPQLFFTPQNASMRDEYGAGIPLGEVFSVIGSGLNTDRDDLCIDFDKAPLSERMQKVFSGTFDTEFVDTYNLRPSSSYDPVTLAKRQVFDPKALRICIYRPFDFRHIYYKVGFTSRPVFEVHGHMLQPNTGLLVCRQSKEPFAVLVTHYISTHKIVAVYDRTSLVPLWLYQDESSGQQALKANYARAPSFTSAFAKTLASKLQLRCAEYGLPQGLTPEDIFHYIYAVFHSPTYRTRYAEFLKIDFPRLPLTASLELFRALAALGGELVALHLLESPKLDQPITTYTGPAKPEVEKVSYAHNTVWLDKAQSAGFGGVPEAVWNFHIGGYQVCEKWLKDRKGRALSKQDIEHYQRIVVALSETIRLMQKIDQVIEKHGGWPGAFAASAEAAPATGQSARSKR